MPIGSVLVDFDGTTSLHDVAEHLLVEFADPSWPDYDAAWERGEIDARECLAAQAAMLRAPLDEMLAFASAHCAIDPTFPPFVRWLRDRDVPVTIVSDGFGFYITPLLAAAGLGDLPIRTNTWTGDAAGLRYDHGHPECIGCGTCKMRAVLEARARGPVAFVGDGSSDRFGAIYADVVFAKGALVRFASSDGVPFLPWTTFDDVRTALETVEAIPGPVGADPCPGWRVA